MSDMDLYDPEFPCDSDLLEGAAANQDVDANNTIATHDECFQIQLSSIELPSEPYRPELFKNAETNKFQNKETCKSPSEETSKSPNKEICKSPSKETRKSPNKEICKSPSKERCKSPNKETSKSPNKETCKSPNKERCKSPKLERSSKDRAKAADSADNPKKSTASAVVENTIIEKIDDTDGDDAIEDDARYRDELKKLTTVRQTKESESKSAKDVPLEIYLGPSVGFRVDLTMNKSRKLSVESVAKKRHDDMFERPSPERRGRAKSDAKSVESPSRSKTDFRSSSKTPVKSDMREESSSGEVSRQKKSSGRNEYSNVVESGSDSDRDLRALLRKREAENQALLAVPRVVKMKHMDGKSEESLVNRSDETSSSRKSRPHDNDRDDNIESSNRKTIDYGGSESKRSKHRRGHEAEMERMELDHAERKDGSTSRKSNNAREKEKDPRDNNKDLKWSNSSKHGRDEYEQSRHRSEDERARGAGRIELKELSYGKSRDRERPPESDTDPDHRSRRKRRNSRSASNEHKKKARKSKSRSPKRKRDRSKSGDRRRAKDGGRSKSQESRKKKSESKSESRPKNDEDERHHVTPPPRHKKEHRHHRSRSKTPTLREPEPKKSSRTSRHFDVKESSYYVEQWPFDDVAAPRSDTHRSKSKQQPSLRELQERSTSLLEACMKTRYENQGSGDDRRRSRKHRRQDKHDFAAPTLNFGRLLPSGKPGSVDYITLSDSDEGIVWSDNEETTYANYSCLPVRNEATTSKKNKKKKQKYEEIYGGRGGGGGGGLQCVENRLPSRSPPPKPSSKSRSQKEPSLSPSKIIAINLKRRENSWRKKMEKLKITKDVSRSSLEPGEIEDGSSLEGMSDNNNGVIEDTMTAPTRRMVSLVNDAEANRRPGDKVPIQIHVITSHGDGRGGVGGVKADEIVSTTDCDENVTGFVTTTDDAVGTEIFPTERGDQKTNTLPGLEEEEEEGMCAADERDSEEKELAGDLVICTGNSPAIAEKPLTKAELDVLDAAEFERSVAEEFERRMMAEEMMKNAERQATFAGSLPVVVDAKSKDIFDFVTRRNDNSLSRSPKTEAIPGLGDTSPPSPVMELEDEPPQVGGRNLSSFYHIKKKTHLEQTSLDLIVEPVKAQGPHPVSPRKALIQKDELSKASSSSPLKSPSVESLLAAASHQMPSILSQSVPGLSKTAAPPSSRVPEGPLQVNLEPPTLSSDRTPSKISIPKPTPPPSNSYMLSQNAIVDLLASFPSASSTLTQQPVSSSAAAVVTSHDDNPISKFLAAFNPMLATFGTATSSANSQSQKLIDDIVKSTSAVPVVGSPQLSSVTDSKSGAVSDDHRLTNIFNMQKKLFELTRISTASAVAPQPAAPISQKLVQDIFKAVLVPVSSAKSASSDVCPRGASEMAVSLSEDNSLSPSSPFNVDAASPLSGEIMSFSPPSIPDTSSPPPPAAKKSGKKTEKVKPTSESKSGSTQKSKNKDGKMGKSKPEEDAKDKKDKSKSDIQKVVVEEVKSIIRPFYSKGRINKDEYKEIMRKTVPSICNSKTQDFSKTRITIYVEAYIRKVQATRKYQAKKKDK